MSSVAVGLLGVAALSGCITVPTMNGPDALLSLSSGPTATAASPDESARAAIQTVLQQNPAMLGTLTAAVVQDFYQKRQFTPAWTDAQGLTPRGHQVYDVIETAWVDGLISLPPVPMPPSALGTPPSAQEPALGQSPATPPEHSANASPTDPHSVASEQTPGTPSPLAPEERAHLDIALTVALADYAQRAAATRRAPTAPLVVSAALKDIATDDPTASEPGRLFRLFSDEDRQARLRRAVLRYEAIAQAGGWPSPPLSGPKLEPGAVHPDIALVRARLKVTGDATGATPPNPFYYDAALVEAVQRFQHRQGLSVDGKIGANTREALATPVDQRLQQMALNLDRLRAMPPAPAGRSIEVNIAAAALEGRDDGLTTFRTDVIVGRSDRPTPELTSAINTVVLNPTWTVPTTIAQKDLLPKIQRDPEYLTRSGFTVYDGWERDSDVIDPTTIDWSADNINIRAMRLRQAPGDDNALGRIKFLFPNDYDVYLHSTPSRSLFGRSERAFSSGCVRVRDPMDLAAFVLNDGVHTADSVSKEIEEGGTHTVHPRKAVPLSIIYVTAWVDGDTVQFRRDVYGEDARQMNRIAKRPTPSASTARTVTAVQPAPPAWTQTGSAPGTISSESWPTTARQALSEPEPTPEYSPETGPETGPKTGPSAIPADTTVARETAPIGARETAPTNTPTSAVPSPSDQAEDAPPAAAQSPAMIPTSEEQSEGQPTAPHTPGGDQAWPPLSEPTSDPALLVPTQTSETNAGALY